MKTKIAKGFDIVANHEERLMALLALTAQELPMSRAIDAGAASLVNSPGIAPAIPTGVAHSFDELDADPTALEVYLRRGMKPAISRPSRASRWQSAVDLLRTWIAPSPLRLAAAVSVGIVAVSIVFWHVNMRESALLVVDASYAEIDLNVAKDSLESLVLPWERTPGSLGFGPSVGNDTAGGRAFAQGLIRGRAKLTGQDSAPSGIARSAERYVALGEWNVLLWAVSQSSASSDSDFWRRQHDIAREMADVSYAREDRQAIVGHLAILEPLLLDMSRSAPSARAARQLSDELTRFREAFAPHSSTVLNRQR